MTVLGRRFGWGLLIGLSFTVSLAAQTNALETSFQAANQQVAQGRFAEGAAAYAQLPVGETTSVALEYNRGLAHARAGELGQARGHWLLAERLEPRNRAVQIALNQMASRWPAASSNEAVGPLAWTDRLTLNEWGGLALILSWLWGGLLLLGRWRPALAEAIRGYAWGTGVLSLLAVGLVLGAWARRTRLPDAIVIRPETAVRISPLDEARTAFSLPEGVRVRSQQARTGWFMVEDPATRRFGWVKDSELLRLPLR